MSLEQTRSLDVDSSHAHTPSLPSLGAFSLSHPIVGGLCHTHHLSMMKPCTLKLHPPQRTPGHTHARAHTHTHTRMHHPPHTLRLHLSLSLSLTHTPSRTTLLQYYLLPPLSPMLCRRKEVDCLTSVSTELPDSTKLEDALHIFLKE